jgi:hypothetical protein
MFYLGGMHVVYWAKLVAAKHAAAKHIQNNSLDKSNTHHFIFTVAEYKALTWSEEDKEFDFNGERYDITHIQKIAGHIKITCYIDTAEAEVVTAIKNFTEKLFPAHQQSGTNDTDVINKITKEYLPIDFAFNFSAFEKGSSSFIKKETHISLSLPANIWHPPTIC